MDLGIRQAVVAMLLPLGLAAVADASEFAGNIAVHGTSPARAEQIRAAAEQVRSAAFKMLLGEEAPRRWIARCAIHVHATPAIFTAAVGMPPTGARGATSIDFSGAGVSSRRIDVMGDGPDVIPDALSHELVHVVLADHFVAAPPPRWADEGIALLFDGTEKQLGHEDDFRLAQRHGFSFTSADLVALEEYPADARRQRVFYGQSAALVRWLIARRDAATFIRFVDDIAADGLTTSLKRHYELDSIAFLDSAWKEVPPIHTLSLSNRK
ncbi:MAG: hypothetical protein WCJ18_03785 [Planctomycetota bacterium]